VCFEVVINTVNVFVFQIQNNWSYGEVLDENSKTHPMLRPYKTFSEKVRLQASSALRHSYRLSLFLIALTLPLGQRDLPLAHQRVSKSHVGLGMEPRQSQRGRGVREEEGSCKKNLPDCSGIEQLDGYAAT